MTKTLWRELLYKELSKIDLTGPTLDVGGDRASHYHVLMHHDPEEIRVANLEAKEASDITCDLEEGIPVPDSAFKNVLCINVLEHIFKYQQLLTEMSRVMQKDGVLVLAVPFIIAYHPSPRDHWRFTAETLERIVSEAGFKNVQVKTVGTGVFGALFQLSHGFLHFNIARYVVRALAIFLDKVVSRVRKESVYSGTYYPLGYVVTAKK